MTELPQNWQANEEARREWMAENSLYRAEDEHSSCGVGFVVSLDGTPSRQVVQRPVISTTTGLDPTKLAPASCAGCSVTKKDFDASNCPPADLATERRALAAGATPSPSAFAAITTGGSSGVHASTWSS